MQAPFVVQLAFRKSSIGSSSRGAPAPAALTGNDPMARIVTTFIAAAAAAAATVIPLSQSHARDRRFAHYHGAGPGWDKPYYKKHRKHHRRRPVGKADNNDDALLGVLGLAAGAIVAGALLSGPGLAPGPRAMSNPLQTPMTITARARAGPVRTTTHPHCGKIIRRVTQPPGPSNPGPTNGTATARRDIGPSSRRTEPIAAMTARTNFCIAR